MSGTDRDSHQIGAAVADLLQKKGTLEMIVQIGEHRTQRHTDLRKELLLSSSTIQERLKDGKKQGLWEQTLEERGDIAAKVYRLTPLGNAIYDTALDVELDQLYRSKRGIIRAIDNRERRVIVNLSPTNAEWLTDITMEEHELHSVQQFLQQFKTN
jgi:DNA-binding PadR family transcriptional regulator